MESNGYNPIPYNNFNLSNQLLTPPGSDPSYSPDQNGYYSPEQHQQQLHQESLTSQLSYNQCMQGEAIPTTTVIHQPLSHHPSQQQQSTNLSPVNQVSPQQQVSPSSSSTAPTATSAMASNIATSANLQLFMRSMQGGFANVTPEQQQRLLLQESEARRLSHINSIAAAGYSQTLPTTLELSSTRKKRKMGSPSSQQTQPIKSEPGKTQTEHDYSDADQETNSENYRSLPWTEYNREKWARMLDMSGQPIDGFKYTVSADKGFVHSEAHVAFVSQKKNHFQVTVSAYGVTGAKYLKVENGLEGIRGFHITLHGFKNENKDHLIPINQSTVERQKYSLDPQRVEFQSGSLTKTIPRLHFSATTENNMRKKGKPNPNQRFFSLVVSLNAETNTGKVYPVAICISDRIIVRASSPSNFDLEQQLWERVDASSIRYMGNVGINMERPEHATLAVGGNLLVSGNITQYSDRRVKENIRPASTADELHKVKQLNLYKYQYTEDFSKQNNIDIDEPQFGVIAQEVQNILPDAVKRDGGSCHDPDASSSTSSSSNLLTVNKDRIYMAGVGAVKELSGITDDIIEKIDQLEQVNTGLVDRFKRKFGSKSTLNSNFTKCGRKQKSIFSSTDSLKSEISVRKSLKMMQKAVCALSGVVILCLAAVICMFVVMHHNATIVSSHHPIAKPSENKSIPVPPTDSAEQTKTVVMPYTYGPSHTPPPPIHPDIFDTAKCDITQLPGLSSSKYELQYSQQGKRLDCKYTVSLSVEEYAMMTNKNYLTVDIAPGQSGVKSQRCQFKTSSCTTAANGNNVFMSNHSPLNHTAIEALQGKTTRNSPTKQLTGQKQEFSFYLVSGISKITSRIRLLPSSASCHECCHVSGGEYLDVHYSFTFTCPKDNKDTNQYKIITS